MKAPQWVRLVVLAFAVMSVAGVLAVVACAPAAPASQSGGGSGSGEKENPTETPMLTPTLHPDCVTLTLPGPDGSKVTSCPPPGPENVEVNLRRYYNQHMADKKDAQEGRRSAVEPLFIDITVETTTHEAVDAVAEFLDENADGGVIHRYKFDSDHPRGHVGAVLTYYVRMELIPRIASIDGVKSVAKTVRADYGSGLRQSGGAQGVTSLLGVDQWRALGVDGSGVEVAVLDTNFKDFVTRVVPRLAEPAKYFCYDSVGLRHEGYVPTLTPTPGQPPVVLPGPSPTPSFVACEDRQGVSLTTGRRWWSRCLMSLQM